MPTDRPILFSGPMVRALLAGTKTQTRRIVKPRPAGDLRWGGWITCSTTREDEGKAMWGEGDHLDRAHRVRCPYGQPGDRLWVRETFAHTHLGDGSGMYVFPVADPRTDYGGPWKPSIHMPRVASRITLEITEVRVERLQAISEADAKAEGITNGEHDPGIDKGGKPGWCYGQDKYAGTPRHAYELLWESINGPGSWDATPWVWVVSFKRVMP